MATLTIGHCVISDDSRRDLGHLGAFDDAARRLRDAYEKTARGFDVGKGARFHLVLTVERPESAEN